MVPAQAARSRKVRSSFGTRRRASRHLAVDDARRSAGPVSVPVAAVVTELHSAILRLFASCSFVTAVEGYRKRKRDQLRVVAPHGFEAAADCEAIQRLGRVPVQIRKTKQVIPRERAHVELRQVEIEAQVRHSQGQQPARSKQPPRLIERGPRVRKLLETVPDENCVRACCCQSRVVRRFAPNRQPLTPCELRRILPDVEPYRTPVPLLRRLEKSAEMAPDLDHGRARPQPVLPRVRLVAKRFHVSRIHVLHQVRVIGIFFVRIRRADLRLVPQRETAGSAPKQTGGPVMHKIRKILQFGALCLPAQPLPNELISCFNFGLQRGSGNRSHEVSAAADRTRREWHAHAPEHETPRHAKVLRTPGKRVIQR